MRWTIRITVALLGLLLVPAAGALPVGHFFPTVDSGPYPDYAWVADHHHIVDLYPWDTSTLYALKEANPNVKVLMYKDASAASTSSDDGLYATGVSYDQASRRRWLLQNTGGSPFTFGGYPWLWAADIGSADYQQAWASNVLGELTSAPWDGVFIDDVNPTIKWHYCLSCVKKYPSDDLYARAMTGFVRAVGPALQRAGYMDVANIGSWPDYTSTVDPWLRSLSGAMDEMFLKWGTDPHSGYADPATWATQLREIDTTESGGKLFIGLTHSAANDEKAAIYGYATALLAGAGHTVYGMGDRSSKNWFSQYSYDLGDPVGSYSIDANGVYRRTFSNGLVLVNPTTSPQGVDFGATYSGSGLTDAASVTMAPQSGLILVKNDPVSLTANVFTTAFAGSTRPPKR